LHYDTQDSIKQSVPKTTFKPEHSYIHNDGAAEGVQEEKRSASRQPHELENLISGVDGEQSNSFNSEKVMCTIQPRAQVQPFKLTFNEGG